MTDRHARNALGRTSSHVSDAGASSSIRPRNRRLAGDDDAAADKKDIPSSNNPLRSPLLFAFGQQSSASTSRDASPLALPRRVNSAGPTRVASAGNLGQFFSESWNQSWNSVTDLTSSLFAQEGPERRGRTDQNGLRKANAAKTSSAAARAWGPAPPSQGPRLDDVAAGSLAGRQSALKAARTASVLQSHEGVNGGLDVAGKHKRRDSNEVAPVVSQGQEEYLVYVHHVQPSDTYAGLILRYKCHEEAFRRANGLWSRDSVQTKKWLTIPVDACEIRGRPCEPPSGDGSSAVPVDLLAATPRGDDDDPRTPRETGDGYFGGSTIAAQSEFSDVADDKPWTHVRWVKIDSLPQPVEIGRVSKGAMGYFPPRRKRSIRTVSSFSTPRQSLDLSSNTPGSAGASSSRRLSSLGSRPPVSGSFGTRNRLGSDGSNARPVWMNQPGGVGTMSRSVKAPGPDRDPLNTWTRKHIPGLNIDGPSMSIMGSETAHFGFSKDAGGDSTGIVENHFPARDVTATNQNGTPLDRAAAAVETWLRGALAKRPSTPLTGATRSNVRGSPFGGDAGGDLIELADTNSDDGRFNMDTNFGPASHSSMATSGRDDDSGLLRGRTMGSGLKGAKAD